MIHFRKSALLGGVTLGALSLMSPALAQNQTANQAAQTKDDVESVKDIIVTGSRTITNGDKAPTPVTVQTIEELKKAAPISLPQALNQLPQFAGSQTGRNQSGGSNFISQRGNTLSLRNLGPIRTLILLDGQRVPPSRYTGTVDLNTLPEMLVKRVDIVTGGASAIYGSDAVSGVVNYILDDNLKGFKVNVQGGVSNYGDGTSYRAGVAGGIKLLDDRAHILFSAEHAQQNPVWMLARDWKQSVSRYYGWATTVPVTATTLAASATNPLVLTSNIYSTTFNLTGHITGGPAGFTNLTTSDDGRTVSAYNAGVASGIGAQVGGNGAAFPSHQELIPGTTTDQFYGQFRYDVTPNIRAKIGGTYSRSDVQFYGSGNALVRQAIFSGNPYIPAALQAAMTAAGTPSVAISKYLSESQPTQQREKIDAYTGNISLSGKLAGSWKFDSYYVFGYTHTHAIQSTSFQYDRLAAALDAVRDPANAANIVCRVSITNPGLYPGCTPFNPFGYSQESQAALDYVQQPTQFWTKNTTNDVGLSFSGNALKLPAGIVAVSLGAQYRTGKLNVTSNSDPAVPVSITGLRGLAATTNRFFLLNQGVANGSVKVAEFFGEANIPILKNLPLIDTLDVDLAGRRTHYSTSGWVSTWKIGLSWKPFHDLRLRGTLSRDIRAPSLYELFAGKTINTLGQFDPHVGISGVPNIIGGGNANLKPEKGKTWAIGAVYQPSWFPRFNLSVDYYNIKITGAIGNVPTLNILQDCENSGGTSATCALITRPLPFSDRSAANVVQAVQNIPINTAYLINQGIDFDAGYHFDLDSLSKSLPGRMSLRAVFSYVMHYKTVPDAISPVFELAGTTDAQLPKLRGQVSANYDVGNFGLFTQVRYIGRMRGGPTPNVTIAGVVTPATYNPDHLKPVAYLDMTGTYRLNVMGTQTEFYLSVSNLLNRKPPIWPSVTSSIGVIYPTLLSAYDTMGRYFTVGARVKF